MLAVILISSCYWITALWLSYNIFIEGNSVTEHLVGCFYNPPNFYYYKGLFIYMYEYFYTAFLNN
jgi:hypothetical protein